MLLLTHFLGHFLRLRGNSRNFVVRHELAWFDMYRTYREGGERVEYNFSVAILAFKPPNLPMRLTDKRNRQFCKGL